MVCANTNKQLKKSWETHLIKDKQEQIHRSQQNDLKNANANEKLVQKQQEQAKLKSMTLPQRKVYREKKRVEKQKGITIKRALRHQIQATNRQTRLERAKSKELEHKSCKRKRPTTPPGPILVPTQMKKKQKTITPRVILCKQPDSMYTQRQRTLTGAISDANGVDTKDVGVTGVFTYTVALRPTKEQRAWLSSLMGGYRYTYNSIVSMYRNPEACQSVFGVTKPPLQDVRKHVIAQGTLEHRWLGKVPYNAKELAPREYQHAVNVARKLHPNGKFQMDFKSLRKSTKLTTPLGKRSVSFGADGASIFPQANSGMLFRYKKITPALSTLLNSATGYGVRGVHPEFDCKLIYDRGSRRFVLQVSVTKPLAWTKRYESEYAKLKSDGRRPENQRPASPVTPVSKSVISLDPGVRTFMTGYSPDGTITEVAPQSVQRLCRLSHHMDRLQGKISKAASHQVRLRLRRARFRMQTRLANIRKEVHRKCAHYIATTFDVILLPEFGSKRMVNKHTRKISTNTVRRLLLWAHYKFRQHMIAKAKEHGKVLLIVNEAYTTKTCCRCGWQHHKLGKKKRFVCRACGLDIDRDVNGSRNILLRNSM
jgi:IS605 OrfB family transposase